MRVCYLEDKFAGNTKEYCKIKEVQKFECRWYVGYDNYFKQVAHQLYDRGGITYKSSYYMQPLVDVAQFKNYCLICK